MGERTTVCVKMNEDVWEQFQKYVVEVHGQKYGNMGREAENALSEYMDRDRTARVEDKVDRVLARLDDLDDTHTHKASETTTKVNDIVERVAAEDRTVIPDDMVRRAIEQRAGADDRTIRKYREQLKRRGEAYQHPADSPVWTLDARQFALWVKNYRDNNPAADLHDCLDNYPMDIDEWDRLVEQATDNPEIHA